MTVRAEYDRIAPDYDRRWATYNRASLALLRPWIQGRDLGRVLDVGCGTGNLLALMSAGRMDRYAGVDLSPEMLGVARSKASTPRTGFVAGDAERLPMGDAAFDTVVTASVMQYWVDARAGLAEIRRVLRPGGRLLLLDWLRDPLAMRLLNAWMRLTGVQYRRMYSRAEMADALAATGFRIDAEARASAGVPWRVIAFDARAV